MAGTKTPAPLSITKATRQARRIVDEVMPGVMATVDSKLSHDLATDTPLVITTVTFPAGQHGRGGLALLLAALPGFRSRTVADSRITIARSR